MKIKSKYLAVIAFTFAIFCQLLSQGYIVQNGVVSVGLNPGIGYQFDVSQNPTNSDYTGFFLDSQSADTFKFSSIVDEGVRVFLVSTNDPVSLQPILSQRWTELLYPNIYLFSDSIPFYVGLYTGYAPVNGIYRDPLFGWALLVNNQGAIQMLGGALEYGGAGIYAGTQNIIPIPEPSSIALGALGTLLVGLLHWKNYSKQRN